MRLAWHQAGLENQICGLFLAQPLPQDPWLQTWYQAQQEASLAPPGAKGGWSVSQEASDFDGPQGQRESLFSDCCSVSLLRVGEAHMKERGRVSPCRISTLPAVRPRGQSRRGSRGFVFYPGCPPHP